MSLLKEIKQGLQEVANKEAKLVVKEYLTSIGGGLVMSLGAYLFASHAIEFGRHTGRAEVLDMLTDAAEELESSNEDNKN